MEMEAIFSKYPALKEFEARITSATGAVGVVQAGNNVYLGAACATPRRLAHALESLAEAPRGLTLFHFLTDGALPEKTDASCTRFAHKCFVVGGDTRAAIKHGIAEYIPISLAQVPKLIENGRISIDVAFVQVSPPDEFGYCSLGISVDVTASVVKHARYVIAEINPNMPRTMGESFVHVGRFKKMVWNDSPLLEYTCPPADEVTSQIAQHIASIIDDGSTLQVGLGQIPQEVLKYLENRIDLGIHSDVVTDAIIDLIEKRAITGRAKSQDRRTIVTSYCMGTRKLYDLIDRNPLFSFRPIESVANAHTISLQSKMVSITEGLAVDLTGQVCADQFEGAFCSGVSTQLEFLRGAAQSSGGKPIICLPSTSADGKTSRIRLGLQAGEGVTVARSDVHYVITEYGIAYLFGKSIQERALALIEIAHPDFRAALLKKARKHGYIKPGQALRKKSAYAAHEERSVLLRNQKNVLIRPIKTSDTLALEQFFQRMSKEDRYTRFFRRLNNLSASEAQHLCRVDQDSEVAFLAVSGPKGKESIIGSACYFVNPATNLAEVAYMVSPQWQGVGIGTAMQLRLMEHAKSRRLRGFSAVIQTYNANMINLAKRACDDITIQRRDDTYEVTMLFE